MKTLNEHIEHVKGKPHHIRRRVAFTVAGAATGLIALVWLVGSVSFGLFAIPDHNFADSTQSDGVQIVSEDQEASSGLAGVGAAFAATNQPAHIEIVDTTPKAATTKKPEETVIPF